MQTRSPERDAILAAIGALRDPELSRLLTPARIDALAVEGGLVQLSLQASREEAAALEPLRARAEAYLASLPGMREARVVLTASRAAPPPAPPAGRTAAPGAAGHAPHGQGQPGERLLTQARFVVAIASGKGGVGKSTAAVNLAVALAARGLRVGLVDADIHGPSEARMLGVARRPEVRGDRLIPIEAHGVACMSMAFMVPENQAMIWRGPMVMGALQQILGQTDWGPRDVMIIDLPPGTGDAQLTLTQKVRLDGAVIISTPQDIALIDARRGVAMFQKLDVPILGLIENMSHFTCPHCGGRSDIFGHGGAREEAARLGVPFLGEVPLRLAVREAGDAGAPIVASGTADPAAQAFTAIAGKIWEILTSRSAAA